MVDQSTDSALIQADYLFDGLNGSVQSAQAGRVTGGRIAEVGIDLMEHAEFLDPGNEMSFDPKLA